jgi:DNA-binding NtrC family response regulator
MHHAQVLVYESDGKLAEWLRDVSRKEGFRLSELRQPRACLAALRRNGPGVLLIKVGRDLEREMSLLEEASRLFPETQTVIVGDSDHAGLAALAWDLGAAFVLMPPTPLELLPDIVVGLLPGKIHEEDR